MEFRLVYRGPLSSSSRSNSRATEKHQIRKQLSPQLHQFWKEHPHLKHFLTTGEFLRGPSELGEPQNLVTRLAKQFSRGAHTFVPLVREQDDTYCSLNILFLRRDAPGRIVTGGGDLDNRLKTLLDALKVPQTTDGLPDVVEQGFDPIFCLLQDDSQITSLSVIADRILAPLEAAEREKDVVLVIHVHVYRGTNAAQVTGLPGNL
ncbi:MAG: hypothetical protein LAP38_16515 [Acidobacteriia bacterium]|nr:hypothetical protein [Terriglobia bacterium]